MNEREEKSTHKNTRGDTEVINTQETKFSNLTILFSMTNPQISKDIKEGVCLCKRQHRKEQSY